METMETTRELVSRLQALVGKRWIYKKRPVTVTGFKIMHGTKLVVFTREQYSLFGLVSRPDDLIGQLSPIVPVVQNVPIVRSDEIKTNQSPEEVTQNQNEMPILETYDYDRFSTILGNRDLDHHKIDKIVKDVVNGLNMLPYYPVIVSERNDKLMVIDGQHRLEVSKKTGNPVYYLMCETLDLKQIARINSRSEKWKPADFLNCYIKLGIQDYETLREVVKEYRVGLKVAWLLLMYANPIGKSNDEFQTGEFKCRHYDAAVELLTLVRDLFGKYDFVMDRNLIKAMQVVKAKGVCDFSRLKTKIDASAKMERMTEYKKYLSLLNEIYNYGVQKTTHIY